MAILPEDAAPGAAWTVRADGYREAILAPDLVALRGTTTVRLVGTASFSGRVVAADGAPPDVAVRVRFGDCETGLGDDGLYR
ncbi:MAG TPA: hypothetical protein VEI02_10675, partial [Planctomycetota bacterium]|nr:hypothetical protein [Planctomycetota bacterium]